MDNQDITPAELIKDIVRIAESIGNGILDSDGEVKQVQALLKASLVGNGFRVAPTCQALRNLATELELAASHFDNGMSVISGKNG